MEPSDESDPNAACLKRIRADLESFHDAHGRKLKVWTVPSPGKVTDSSGRILPASYLNFYIANRTVVVPTYGVPADKAAVAAALQTFSGLARTVGPRRAPFSPGGGAFHCITQPGAPCHDYRGGPAKRIWRRARVQCGACERACARGRRWTARR